MKYLITLCVILCNILSLSAQPGQWESFILPDRAGEVLEDEETLWVPTTAGLLEVNKNTGSHQLWNKANSGLVSNSIEGVAQHPMTKDIFIGTYDLALMVREAGSDEWEHLLYPASITQNPGQMIRTYCLEFDEEGILWVGTDLGLLRYDGADWEVMEADNNTFLGAVWDIEVANNGKIYVSSHGLFELEDGTLNMISPEDAVEEQFLFGYGYSTVQLLPDNTLWFFTDTGTCGYYDGGGWSQLEHIPEMSFTGNSFSIWQEEGGNLQVVIPGRFWYEHSAEGWQQVADWNTLNDVIRIAPLEDGSLVTITGRELKWEDGNSMTYSDYPFRKVPFNFNYDTEEELWVIDSNATLLNVAEGASFYVEGEGAPVSGFTKYAFTEDGRFWCAAGASVYSHQNGTWSSYDYTNSSLPLGYIRLLEIGPDGNPWLLVNNHGIYQFNNGSWQKQNHFPFEENYISDIQPVNGGLWISMFDEDINPVLGFWDGTNFDLVDQGESGYENVHLNELLYRDGRLWALGYDNLQYLESGSWQAYDLPFVPEEGEYFRHMILRDDLLIIHSRYSIWIEQQGAWHTFTAANSPMDNSTITEVGLDKTGGLWITHDNKPIVDRYDLGLLSNSDVKPAIIKSLNVIGNPVSGNLLKLQFDQAHIFNNSLQITIFDAVGRKYPAHLMSVEGNLLKASVNSLVPGWYTAVVQTEGARYLASFVKQ